MFKVEERENGREVVEIWRDRLKSLGVNDAAGKGMTNSSAQLTEDTEDG